MLPDAEDDDDTDTSQGGVIVSTTARQPVALAQGAKASDFDSIVRTQKAKAGKGERIKERKGKKDRAKGQRLHRR